MLLATAIVEVILASLVVVPLLRYRLKAKRWNKLVLPYPVASHDTELTILLPIWNESLVIEKKLANLKREYPSQTSLLVVDSASTDDSVSLVNRWITSNSEAFTATKVIEMPERLGKTSAVKLAVEYLTAQSYSGLVLMTDADSLIAPQTVERLHGWFTDTTIGVVGSSANRKTSIHGEQGYRAMYELLRSAESKIDSTPFLEGSCMMWRHGSFDAADLNTDCNADDAQIASLIRIGGLRSVFDSEASFIDFAPSTIEGQRRQKIRRAQGLQNMLKRFSHHHKLPDEGRFAEIFNTQYYLHITAPIILFQIAIASIIRWLFVSISGMPVGYEAVIHALLAFVELMILVSWLTYRSGIKLPFVTLIGSLITSFEYLFIANFRNARGIQSNMWEQHQDTRKLFKNY
tara:strand:+ start:111 stop:1322 length:1212 start_codon:yes stop_codon:yes gene_type:complete